MSHHKRGLKNKSISRFSYPTGQGSIFATKPPEQLELVTEKDLEITQLKEILITKDKEINSLNKAIASRDSEITQLQEQITEAIATIAQQEAALQKEQQAHTELLSQTSKLHEQVQKLSNALEEKEQAIFSLQTDLANSSVLVNEQHATQDSEPTELLSESAQLTKAMITLTGVITKLTQQFSGSEKTPQNLTIPQLLPSSNSTIQKTITKRSRSASSERIEKAIALVIEHNLNSPLEKRWQISYSVLADLLGISLTPITAFFNDEKNQQLVKEVAQHHQDLGLTNNTHNRSYHPKQKITQFLKLPD